jgi:LPPG:FO 2-phospho-L-lactate transferase
VRVTVLVGGVGGAKFLLGLRAELARAYPDGAGGSSAEITAVVNTGDDLWLTGLRVCPDLDSVTYALAGENDTERGWGRKGETERVSAEIAAFGLGWPWFTLGDLDLGMHIARSHLLREGKTLSEATAQLTARWQLGVRLLPTTDDEVETHVVVDDEDAGESGGTREIHFEEWWVRHRASLEARAFVQSGVESAVAAPGVLEAIRDADVVLVAPSNPVVSIGTILGIPGIRDAVRATAAPVVGVSPVIDGAAVRGMAEACLRTIDVAPTADAIGLHYGPRSDGGLIDGWLIDETDAAVAGTLEAAGIATRAVPLWMRDEATSARLAADALALALSLPLPRSAG